MVTKLSIFLPAYNEGGNLPSLIASCSSFGQANLELFEIIIVDDGSTDETEAIVGALAKKYPHLRLVRHPANLGYGQAIKTGLKSARYPWVFFMDSDNQFKIEDLKSFLQYDSYDLVIGYRLKRDDPINRLIASRVYALFVKALFGLKVRDIDCAFKLMNKRSVNNLSLESKSFFISTELLVQAKAKGLTIKEIGVHHYPRQEGKSSVTINRIVQSLLELRKLYAAPR